MELFLSHWICITIIIVLFAMWVYTLKSDNDRFKAIIDKHVDVESEPESMKSKPSTKRTYSPVKAD